MTSATASSSPGYDAARAEAFAEKVTAILNGGALSLMLSIGHRSGLFDVMSRLDPASSEAIAAEAGFEERYVREWLGAMVAGGLVDYEPAGRTYHLPPEHAASLTRAARPGNQAATAQWIPVLAGVEEEILRCFQEGGGVAYEAYPRFHAVMAEESDQTVVACLLDRILPAVPGLVPALERGVSLADVGCGSGRALVKMAAAFPRSRFTGFDVSPAAVGRARALAREQGLANLRFEVRDAAALAEARAFDVVTAFDAIHDQARPAVVLENVVRALRPGGTFLMQDIAGTSDVHRDRAHPLAPFLYTISCLHCMTVSLAQGGDGLGAMWGEATARRMLREAGFRDVDVMELPHDALNLYYVATAPD